MQPRNALPNKDFYIRFIELYEKERTNPSSIEKAQEYGERTSNMLFGMFKKQESSQTPATTKEILKEIVVEVKGKIYGAQNINDWIDLIIVLRQKAEVAQSCKGRTGEYSLLYSTLHGMASELILDVKNHDEFKEKKKELIRNLEKKKEELNECIKGTPITLQLIASNKFDIPNTIPENRIILHKSPKKINAYFSKQDPIKKQDQIRKIKALEIPDEICKALPFQTTAEPITIRKNEENKTMIKAILSLCSFKKENIKRGNGSDEHQKEIEEIKLKLAYLGKTNFIFLAYYEGPLNRSLYHNKTLTEMAAYSNSCASEAKENMPISLQLRFGKWLYEHKYQQNNKNITFEQFKNSKNDVPEVDELPQNSSTLTRTNSQRKPLTVSQQKTPLAENGAKSKTPLSSEEENGAKPKIPLTPEEENGVKPKIPLTPEEENGVKPKIPLTPEEENNDSFQSLQEKDNDEADDIHEDYEIIEASPQFKI